MSTPLEYSPRPPLLRRRWRRGLAVAAIILLSAAAWRWGRVAWDKVTLLYHQHYCLNYTAPPDQVVFDSNPARVAVLAGDHNFAIVRGCAFRKPSAHSDAYPTRFGTAMTPTRQRAILFLHECRSPDGTRFLVELERTAAADESAYFLTGYDVEANVFRPATATRPADPIMSFADIDVTDSFLPHTGMRIFAGQPDPADPSHFTIRFEDAGKVGTVDGRVDNNGRLSLRRSDQE